MNTKTHLSTAGSFWWVVLCIFSCGGAYFTKLLIMKALIDVQG